MISLKEIKETIKKKGKFWIAFTGDSITSCEWVHPNWREIVEYVLKQKLRDHLVGDWQTAQWQLRFFNFAYDGATTRDILNKLPEITTVKTDLLIAVIGANDPFRDVSVSEHNENIIKLKNSVEKSGTKFIFSTCNNPDRDVSSSAYLPYVEADRKLADTGGKFVNLYEESDTFPRDRIYTFKFEEDDPLESIKKGDKDFWHPNQLGNAYIAKVMLKEVFDISFDPEKYWKDTLAGEKMPKY